MSSTVVVGSPTDTGPTYTVTITRHPDDTITDWTAATGVVLVLPDGSTKTVTKTSATASQWIGTVTYNGWFTQSVPYNTRARATFPSMTLTIPDELTFSVH